jgi:hypothetical protein
MALPAWLEEESSRNCGVTTMRHPKRKNWKAERGAVDVIRIPPFTRLSSHNVATTDDFERERMGLGAKE